MDQPIFSFGSAAKPSPAKTQVEAPMALAWTFDARSGLDKPFHALVSEFGDEVIMDLDQIVLDSPIKAAARATRVFKQYSSRVGRDGETRDVMTHMASVLKPSENVLDELALVPPEAVFSGFERPRS